VAAARGQVYFSWGGGKILKGNASRVGLLVRKRYVCASREKGSLFTLLYRTIKKEERKKRKEGPRGEPAEGQTRIPSRSKGCDCFWGGVVEKIYECKRRSYRNGLSSVDAYDDGQTRVVKKRLRARDRAVGKI